LTDKQFADIIRNMIIIVDTREQKNQHLLDYFKQNNIRYAVATVNHGDYTFEIDMEEYKHLNRCICVEKKNSLNEIVGNFTSGRERFHREFQRAREADTKMHLVVENATWKKVVNESYRSKISEKAVRASIQSFSARYDCPVWFVGKDESPMVIHDILYYGLREKLLKRG